MQHLVDLVEDWRFCKRLEIKRRCELAREASRKLESPGVISGSVMASGRTKTIDPHVEVLARLLKDHLQ